MNFLEIKTHQPAIISYCYKKNNAMYFVPMSDRINFKIMIQVDVWIPSTAVFQYDKREPCQLEFIIWKIMMMLVITDQALHFQNEKSLLD